MLLLDDVVDDDEDDDGLIDELLDGNRKHFQLNDYHISGRVSLTKQSYAH